MNNNIAKQQKWETKKKKNKEGERVGKKKMMKKNETPEKKTLSEWKIKYYASKYTNQSLTLSVLVYLCDCEYCTTGLLMMMIMMMYVCVFFHFGWCMKVYSFAIIRKKKEQY